ncbi:late expression factor-7 [Maruca vitrata nucleopolyhedrovirus]|uniref:Late expression factor-7 n=1 Tax=Maruca vitrata nucleopolyhedrovirus TaxID=1307954 RepID=A1YRF6_9ABAC|nr:late expression factor-7 [Maruca vitrata nucleopolyhedrovirus]ABL76046.1 late expression factor-7 [Maruca vitrata nucleopolyhedrovirus]
MNFKKQSHFSFVLVVIEMSSVTNLPLEVIDMILQYLNPVLHAKVVGLTTCAKCRLLRNNNFEDYLKLTPANYHPTTDRFILSHLGITNQPMAPYLVALCSFRKTSCAFFNKCIPADARVATLNWPLPSLENFLSKQFLWYRLARKLIVHERQMDRYVTPSTVQITNEDYCKDDLIDIIDCNIDDMNRCPDLQIDVHLDNDIITLYSYFSFKIYRIVNE